MAKWAVLISGRGSNLAAVLDEFTAGQIVLKGVWSSDPQAYGIWRARRHGVPCFSIPRLENGKVDYPRLSHEIRARGVTGIFLLGFMRILPKSFLGDWQGKVVNLHPSLLPAYPGLDSLRRAFDDQADLGCTVHEVEALVDSGKCVLQRRDRSANLDFAEAERRVHLLEQLCVRRVARRWEPSK